MRNLFVATLLAATLTAQAGGDHLPMGARFAGMGYSGLALTDLWSVRLNPAGLAGLEKPVVGAFYQQHYFASELANQGLAAAIPLGKGTIALGVDRFGYDLYNESQYSLAYAMRFGDGLRAAVQLDYLGVKLGDNYGSTSAVCAEFGIQAKLTDALWVAAHVYNPNRAELSTATEGAVTIDEQVPTLLRGGFAYTFSTKLLMTAEVEKDIDRPEQFRFGAEYNPNKVLFLRTGISTGPVKGHFGAGFRVKQLDIDLAVSMRSQLGLTPMIGLNYRFE
ncbi:MAG: hypothetical protein ABI432_01655 [Flavobacteriales bacterium]